MRAFYTVDTNEPDPEVMALCGQIIRNGWLVAIPTETVYGLAADAFNERAVQSIFAVKGRPSTNPLIVHIETEADVKRVAKSYPDAAQKLAKAFWPGPLSIVLPKNRTVPDIVTAGGNTVAVRCPDHAVARAIIKAAGVPLAAPSANRSNEISPTRAEHVHRAFGNDSRVVGIIDAGPCRVGIESTVIDMSGDIPRILRPGSVTRPMIEAVIGPISEGKVGGIAKSPGMMERHYCPQTPLRLSDELNFVDTGEKVGHIGWNWNEPEQYANGLYEELHRLDQRGFDFIQAWLPPDKPEWAGVRDRLLRAASFTAKRLQITAQGALRDPGKVETY